jgi:hypothetical protein
LSDDRGRSRQVAFVQYAHRTESDEGASPPLPPLSPHHSSTALMTLTGYIPPGAHTGLVIKYATQHKTKPSSSSSASASSALSSLYPDRGTSAGGMTGEYDFDDDLSDYLDSLSFQDYLPEERESVRHHYPSVSSSPGRYFPPPSSASSSSSSPFSLSASSSSWEPNSTQQNSLPPPLPPSYAHSSSSHWSATSGTGPYSASHASSSSMAGRHRSSAVPQHWSTTDNINFLPSTATTTSQRSFTTSPGPYLNHPSSPSPYLSSSPPYYSNYDSDHFSDSYSSYFHSSSHTRPLPPPLPPSTLSAPLTATAATPLASNTLLFQHHLQDSLPHPPIRLQTLTPDPTIVIGAGAGAPPPLLSTLPSESSSISSLATGRTSTTTTITTATQQLFYPSSTRTTVISPGTMSTSTTTSGSEASSSSSTVGLEFQMGREYLVTIQQIKPFQDVLSFPFITSLGKILEGKFVENMYPMMRKSAVESTSSSAVVVTSGSDDGKERGREREGLREGERERERWYSIQYLIRPTHLRNLQQMQYFQNSSLLYEGETLHVSDFSPPPPLRLIRLSLTP